MKRKKELEKQRLVWALNFKKQNFTYSDLKC